ncbi:MAG: ATP-binding protein [archaeon]|nr:ATP-binding protein [archaeon]
MNATRVGWLGGPAAGGRLRGALPCLTPAQMAFSKGYSTGASVPRANPEPKEDLGEDGGGPGLDVSPENKMVAPARVQPLIGVKSLTCAPSDPCLEEVRIWEEIGYHYEAPVSGIWVGRLYPDWHLGRLIDHIRNGVRILTKINWVPQAQLKSDVQFLNLLTQHGFYPIRMISRLREAGAYVYFENQEVAEKALMCLQTKPPLLARRVLGDPFYDDLFFKPTRRIKLANIPGKKLVLTQEDVFNLLRPYGRLQECMADGTSAEGIFLFSSSSICARNCLNGLVLPEIYGGGSLVITFEPYSVFHKFKEFWDYLKSPRLLPFIALAIALTLLAFIEPFRLVNVTQTFALKRGSKDPRDRSQIESQFPFFKAENAPKRKLMRKLKRPPSGIILLNGPKGSGKSRLLKEVLGKRDYSIRVDCSPRSHNEVSTVETFIAQFERTVGFRPSFRFINSMLAFAESFLPKGNQLTQTSTVALNKVLLGVQRSLSFIQMTMGRGAHPVYPVIVFDSFHELIDYLAQTSGTPPTQLINNVLDWSVFLTQYAHSAHIVFVTDSSIPNDIVYAHSDAQARLSRISVGDLTPEESASFIKSYLQLDTSAAEDHSDADDHLGSELHPLSVIQSLQPGAGQSWFGTLRAVLVGQLFTKDGPAAERGFSGVAAGDASGLDDHIHTAVNLLGGRIADLTSLVCRVNDGETINAALAAMLRDAKQLIIRNGFSDQPHDPGMAGPTRRWSNYQLWRLIHSLVSSPDMVISESFVLNSIFEGDLLAYVDVLKRGFFQRVEVPGSATVLRAGSPLIHSAFSGLYNSDSRLPFQRMVFTYQIDKARKKLQQAEEEYRLINPASPAELKDMPAELLVRQKRVAQQIAKHSAQLVIAENNQEAFTNALKDGEIPQTRVI